ncbi:MAG: BREX system ATP-binding domain-containing protein [Pseudomonadota bacterium]
MVRVGELIEHPLWGRGRVRAVIEGGRYYSIAFCSQPGLPRRVLASSLGGARASDPRGVSAPRQVRAAARRGPVAPAPAPRLDEGPAELRQALEALRLGVVPVAGLEALTVAREGELAVVRGALEEARGLLMLSGAYGAGKTHLVEVAESLALGAGFLVARATFDPVELPPSHPLRLYGALARGLRYPDGAGRGLRPLLEGLAERPAHHRPGAPLAHRFLTPAAWALQYSEPALAEEVLDHVEGQPGRSAAELDAALRRGGWRGPRLLALPDYRTFGQVMAYLLGGIAVWAREAGYRGLLVLVDEAEYLERLGSVSRSWATDVLRYLAIASLPPAELAFHPSQAYRGGRAVHRGLPAVFQADQPLVALCAFTPHPAIDRVLRGVVAEPGRRLELESIPPAQLGCLAERILALYRRVHPALDPPESHRRRVQACLTGGFRRGEITTTRQAARLVVEFWDLYRHSPARAVRALAA